MKKESGKNIISDNNKYLVLNVLVDGPKTKQEIIDLTGLTLTPVNSIIQSLQKEKRIKTLEKIPTNRNTFMGRRPNTQATYALDDNFIPDKEITLSEKTNQQIILETLLDGPKTKQEIIDLTGLNSNQIKSSIGSLINKNLVVCIDLGTYALADFEEESTDFDPFLEDLSQKIKHRTASVNLSLNQSNMKHSSFDDLENYEFPEQDPWEDSSTSEEQLQQLEELYRALAAKKAREKNSSLQSKFIKKAEENDEEFSESVRQNKLRQLMQEYEGLQSSAYEDEFDNLLKDFSQRIKENPSEEIDDFEDEGLTDDWDYWDDGPEDEEKRVNLVRENFPDELEKLRQKIVNFETPEEKNNRRDKERLQETFKRVKESLNPSEEKRKNDNELMEWARNYLKEKNPKKLKELEEKYPEAAKRNWSPYLDKDENLTFDKFASQNYKYIHLSPYELIHLLDNLGFKDSLERFSPLTEEEYNKISFLEDLLRKAYKYWNGKGKFNDWCYFPELEKDFTQKSFYKFLEQEVEPIYKKIVERHKYENDKANDYYGHRTKKEREFSELRHKKYEESI